MSINTWEDIKKAMSELSEGLATKKKQTDDYYSKGFNDGAGMSPEDARLANEAKLMRVDLMKRYANHPFGGAEVMELLGGLAIHDTTTTILNDVLKKLHLLIHEQAHLTDSERTLRMAVIEERNELEAERDALKAELENTKKDKPGDGYLLGLRHGFERSLEGVKEEITDLLESIPPDEERVISPAREKQLHEAEIRGMEKAADWLEDQGWQTSVCQLRERVQKEKEPCP